MWHQMEPVRAVFRYAPRVFEETAGLGYDVQAPWPSYFAWRLAPPGEAGPLLAALVCYGFSPDMVAAHVPAAWAVAPPRQVLAARERAVDRMYRVLIGSPGLAEAAELARQAALAAGAGGRPLAAANADLPWPQEPHLVLWHAVNILREHRGTATSRRCWRPGWIRARRWCRSRPSAPRPRRSSPVAAGCRVRIRPAPSPSRPPASRRCQRPASGRHDQLTTR
jgi:hypothetical protein